MKLKLIAVPLAKKLAIFFSMVIRYGSPRLSSNFFRIQKHCSALTAKKKDYEHFDDTYVFPHCFLLPPSYALYALYVYTYLLLVIVYA